MAAKIGARVIEGSAISDWLNSAEAIHGAFGLIYKNESLEFRVLASNANEDCLKTIRRNFERENPNLSFTIKHSSNIHELFEI